MLSRGHFLSLFIFTFAIAVSTGFLLIDVKNDAGDSEEEAPAAEAAGPVATATVTLASLQPVQVRVHIDLNGVLAARVRDEAQALAAEMGALLVEGEGDRDDAVVVSLPAGDAGLVLPVVDRWVALASIWSLRERVALSSAMDFALVLPEESQAELERLLGDVAAAPTVRWLPRAEVAAALAADLTAVSLLPIDIASAEPGLRSLWLESGSGLALGPAGGQWLEERIMVRWTGPGQKDFAVSLAKRIEVPAPPITKIAFTGDIIPSRCVYERQRNLGDYTAAFAFVHEYLALADVTVGSLDASISDAGEPYPCEETFNLLGPPESVEGLTAAGFDVITVATNHAKDCGSTGFGCSQAILDTLANLHDAGIAGVGGGEDLAAARSPAVIERNGVRFAFLAYDDIASPYYGATETVPGTAPLSEESLRQDIAMAKTMADVVFVLPHWGVEYTPYPTSRQVSLGRVAIDAGATLVVGNHPHVVQGLEPGRGTLIFYGLGNFVFDQDWSLETLQGVVVEATFAGDRLLGVSIKPHRIRNMFQPSFVEPDEARVILDRMRAASEYVAGQ